MTVKLLTETGKNKITKVGKTFVLVNMGFIHKNPLAYDSAKTLFTKIKVEKISKDEDGHIWINTDIRGKYVFKNIIEAKKFVMNYLKEQILEKEKENLRIALLINNYKQIMIECESIEEINN